uniref:Uncharacterized protein n=1 Tax=Sphaerodactylus townsendi TaxID=933632 RepID=A0ACB8FKH8_9SAUR
MEWTWLARWLPKAIPIGPAVRGKGAWSFDELGSVFLQEEALLSLLLPDIFGELHRESVGPLFAKSKSTQLPPSLPPSCLILGLRAAKQESCLGRLSQSPQQCFFCGRFWLRSWPIPPKNLSLHQAACGQSVSHRSSPRLCPALEAAAAVVSN